MAWSEHKQEQFRDKREEDLGEKESDISGKVGKMQKLSKETKRKAKSTEGPRGSFLRKWV